MKKSVPIIIGLLIVLVGVGYYFVSGGGGENFQGLMKKVSLRTATVPATVSTQTAVPAATTTTTTSPAPAAVTATVNMFTPTKSPAVFTASNPAYQRFAYEFNFNTSDIANTYLSVVPDGMVQSVPIADKCSLLYTEAFVQNRGVKCKVPGVSTHSFKVEFDPTNTNNRYRAFLTIVDASGKEVATSQQYYVP